MSMSSTRLLFLEEEDDAEEEEGEVKDQNQPRWRVWLDVESSREAAHWLPWRPDKAKGQSEEDCEDPDRQVTTNELYIKHHFCYFAIYFFMLNNIPYLDPLP